MFSFNKKNLIKESSLNLAKGFSMLELMIVIAIFAIMTTVLIVDIPNFRNKSTLDLTVSEVATNIRGAQVYGAAQVGADSTTQVTYKLSFGSNNQEHFSLYKDLVPTEINLNGGFQITKIILKDNSGGLKCNIGTLDVTYKANSYTESIGTALEAKAYVDGESGDTPFNYVDIKIQSVKNISLSNCVRIYANGQIAVASCTTSCP